MVMCSDLDLDLVFATSLKSESLTQAKILTDLVLVWISRQKLKYHRYLPSVSNENELSF